MRIAVYCLMIGVGIWACVESARAPGNQPAAAFCGGLMAGVGFALMRTELED